MPMNDFQEVVVSLIAPCPDWVLNYSGETLREMPIESVRAERAGMT